MTKSQTEGMVAQAFDVIGNFLKMAAERAALLDEKLAAARLRIADLVAKIAELLKEHTKLAKSRDRDVKEFFATLARIAADTAKTLLEHANTNDKFLKGEISFNELFESGVEHAEIMDEAEAAAMKTLKRESAAIREKDKRRAEIELEMADLRLNVARIINGVLKTQWNNVSYLKDDIEKSGLQDFPGIAWISQQRQKVNERVLQMEGVGIAKIEMPIKDLQILYTDARIMPENFEQLAQFILYVREKESDGNAIAIFNYRSQLAGGIGSGFQLITIRHGGEFMDIDVAITSHEGGENV